MRNPIQELADLPIGPIRYFDSITSTNDEASDWAANDAPDLAVVIANEQTQGRGRLNKRWYTPADAGLAFSIILKQFGQNLPLINLNLSRATALGALAVCDALEECYQLPTQIKWPNDVLIRGKKICGILAEAQWFGEQVNCITLGIGINVSCASLPLESEQTFPATCLEDCIEKGRKVDDSSEQILLLRAVLNKILAWRPLLHSIIFTQAWENKLAYRGEWVVAYQDYPLKPPKNTRPIAEGKLLGITPNGAVQLLNPEGEIITLQVGEIHLRKN